jgi:hypothetical protein
LEETNCFGDLGTEEEDHIKMNLRETERTGLNWTWSTEAFRENVNES